MTDHPTLPPLLDGPELPPDEFDPENVYGLLAEFTEPDEVLKAARAAYEHGYRQMDAYSPMPVEGLSDAIGFHRNRLPMIVLTAGVIGGFGGFFLQWYTSTIYYPVIIAGRPFNSWPAFVPITFELTILLASLAAVIGMFWLNGLPRPHHPLFHVPGFAQASTSRFFLCLQSNDPLFDLDKTRLFLEQYQPQVVSLVEFEPRQEEEDQTDQTDPSLN